ncbi:MAG: SPOR domain-containing protein [Pseudomonadota bacterium]
MQAVAQQHIVAAPVKVKTSQQAIIEQLHQQCQQNDSLIMLHGGDGSGKTTIAELFLEQASNYAECAFITANDRSTADRLRAQILNQLFGTISLSDETLSRQIQRQAPLRHAVIVIDSGEKLPEGFLAECVSTVNQLSAIGQKVSVVVVADSRWAYQQKPAPHLRVQGPVMLEVQPMSKEEQVRFIQALLPERQRRLWNFDRIQQFLSTINGYPGEIQQRLQLALATQAQRYKEEQPSTAVEEETQLDDDQVSLNKNTEGSRRPVKLGLVLLIAALLSIAAAGYLNRDTLISYWASANTPAASADEEAKPVETNEPAETAQVAEPAAATNQLPEFDPITEESLALMPEDLAISYREALDNLNRGAAAENDPRELEVGLIKQPSEKVEEATNPEPVETAPETMNLPFQSAAILERSPESYALQIAIISNQQLLTEFRQDYQLTDMTDVYQRNDGAYVIVYGNFDSLDQARSAVQQLPASVQSMEPWAKSTGTMQKEIDQSQAQ